MPTTLINPLRSMEAAGVALGHYLACQAQGEEWIYTSQRTYQYGVFCMPATSSAKTRITLDTRTQEIKNTIEVSMQSSNPGAYVDTAGSWSAGIATLTIGANTIAVGDTAVVSGVTPSGFNGTFIVTAVDSAHSFSYALQSNPGAWSSAGSELTATQWPPLSTPGNLDPGIIVNDDTLTDPFGNVYAVREWGIDDLKAILSFTHYSSTPIQRGEVGQ